MQPTGEIITIDQGNTGSKVSVVRNAECIQTLRLDELTIEGLLPTLEAHPDAPVLFCSVAAHDVRLMETLRIMRDDNIMILTHGTPLPLRLCYRTPRTLGLDRVAAAVGATMAAPEAVSLVADAGTALTLDVLDAPGMRFLGGNISAGVEMRLRALHAYTSLLPEVTAAGACPAFGEDTETALRSGAVTGTAYEIAGAFSRARSLYGCTRLLMCGGDAPLLYDHLPEEAKAHASLHPHLIPIGLTGIYHYNENI